VLQNWVLRKTFGSKREEVIRGISSCVFLTQYYSGDPIVGMQWVGHVALWDKRTACRTWVKKPEERRPLGRPRHRWKDSIKMDLKE